MKDVVFTICAKNYLAQALSLRESYLKYNCAPFYIFLSDLANDNKLNDIPNLIELNEEWLPNWRTMAFKYNVIEFSTSIKPYCINKLFHQGYDKVIYLDPDIFVYGKLDSIFAGLDEKSIVLTPHRCRIKQCGEDLIPEQLLSSVGIYNLGFFAVKNNEIGQSVVKWWMQKLADKCLNDFSQGLFVDQKWMDFVPGFYPNDVLISSDLGLNVATWNIQERDIIKKNDSYFVKDKFGNKDYKLLFFHYSGYSPNLPSQLDKRIKRSELKNFPVIQEMTEEYRKCEMRNGFDVFSKMKYSFNYYTNGQNILDLHRELYRYKTNDLVNTGEPFDSNGYYYALLAKRNLLNNHTNNSQKWNIKDVKTKGLSQLFFKYYLKVKGVSAYRKLLSKIRYYTTINYIRFIID